MQAILRTLLVIGVLCILAAVVLANPRMHDTKNPEHWWSGACCHEKDCRRAYEGEVEEFKNGYRVYFDDGTYTIVTRADTRLKKKPDNPYARDGLFHVCVTQKNDGEWQLRCLYERERMG